MNDTNQASVGSASRYEGDLFVPMKRSAPLHHVQTFVQWKAVSDMNNFYAICRPQRRTIYLQPIDEFPDFIMEFRLKINHLQLNLFELLQGFAQIYFSGLEVFINSAISVEHSRWQITSRYHDTTHQKQLCVNDIYPHLKNILPDNGICIAGIVWTDLYPEGYNFVLGEASVKHRAAVISFGRFETKDFDKASHKDISETDGNVVWKLMKSFSHELCHLMGLEHCKFFFCSMNESSSMSEALAQPLFLCPVCLRKLQSACGFDVLERYQLLQQFLSNIVRQVDSTSRFEESLAWLKKCIGYLQS